MMKLAKMSRPMTEVLGAATRACQPLRGTEIKALSAETDTQHAWHHYAEFMNKEMYDERTL